MRSYKKFSLICLFLVLQNGSGVPWIAEPGKYFGSEAAWMIFHQMLLNIANTQHETIEAVFYGDSLMAWDKDVWAKEWEPYGAVNFGIGGDRVENNLWRMEVGGELDPLHPKVLVIMIGGNNLLVGVDTAEEIVFGIFTIMQKVMEKLPGTRILLLGIIPSNRGPEFWDMAKAINGDLEFMGATYEDITYLGMWDEFLIDSPGYGYVSPDIYPDGLHLSKRGIEDEKCILSRPFYDKLYINVQHYLGYEIYADSMRDTFQTIFNSTSPNL